LKFNNFNDFTCKINVRKVNESKSKKFEDKLKTLCKIFGKIGFLNKVELNIYNELKMCKSVASEKSNQRREMITNECFSGNSSEDKYECDFNDCGKSYKSLNAMKAHKEIHSGVKYSCRWPLCKYETYRKIQLRNHSLIHSREAKFKCVFNECDKSFKPKHSLRCHQKVHSELSLNVFGLNANIFLHINTN